MASKYRVEVDLGIGGIDQKSLNKAFETIQRSMSARKIDILDEKSINSSSIKNSLKTIETAYRNMASSLSSRIVELNKAWIDGDKNKVSSTQSSINKIITEMTHMASYMDKIGGKKLINTDSAAMNSIKQMVAELNSMGIEGEDATKIINQLKTALKNVGTSGTENLKDTNLELSDIVSNIELAAIATAAFHKSLQALKSAIGTLSEVNKAMTDVQMVTEGTTTQTEELADRFSVIGQKYSATLIQVAEGAAEWYRQGKNAADTEKLLAASLTMAKVGALESSEATTLLTSTLNGYKLEAEDAMSVVDALSAVDLASATSIEELAKALQKTANSARLAGVDFNTLIGYIASVSEATRQAPELIGTAYRTMFSRMANVKAGATIDEEGESLNDVEKVLNKFGIKLRDTLGTFRDFDDVLSDVQKKWVEFGNAGDTVAQGQIATAMGMTRQQEIFKSLMENWDSAIKLADVAGNSAGSATKKMDIYSQSIQGHIDKLKASWEEFMNDQDTINLINGVLDILSGLINKLDELGVSGTKVLAFISTSIISISGLFTAVSKISLAMEAIKKLGIAGKLSTMVGLLSGPTGIAIALGVVAAAITVLMAKSRSAAAQAEKLQKQIEDTESKIESTTSKIKDLASAIDELNKKKLETTNGDALAAIDSEINKKTQLLKIEEKYLAALKLRKLEELKQTQTTGIYDTFETKTGNINNDPWAPGHVEGDSTVKYTVKSTTTDLSKAISQNAEAARIYSSQLDEIKTKISNLDTSSKNYITTLEGLRNQEKAIEDNRNTALNNMEAQIEQKRSILSAYEDAFSNGIIAANSSEYSEMIALQGEYNQLLQNYIDIAGGASENTEQYTSDIQEASNSISMLTEAAKQINDLGEISSDIVNTLIEQNPTLLQQLLSENLTREEKIRILGEEIEKIKNLIRTNKDKLSEDVMNSAVELGLKSKTYYALLKEVDANILVLRAEQQRIAAEDDLYSTSKLRAIQSQIDALNSLAKAVQNAQSKEASYNNWLDGVSGGGSGYSGSSGSYAETAAQSKIKGQIADKQSQIKDLQGMIASANAAISAYQSQIKSVQRRYEKLIEQQNDLKEYWEDYYNTLIDNVKDEIDQLDKEKDIKKELLEIDEKREALEKAKQKRKWIYKEGQGFVYDVDAQAIASASSELNDAQEEHEYKEQKRALDDLVDSYEKARDEKIKIVEDEIKRLEDLRDQEVESLENAIEAAQNAIAGYEAAIEQLNSEIEDLQKAYDDAAASGTANKKVTEEQAKAAQILIDYLNGEKVSIDEVIGALALLAAQWDSIPTEYQTVYTQIIRTIYEKYGVDMGDLSSLEYSMRVDEAEKLTGRSTREYDVSSGSHDRAVEYIETSSGDRVGVHSKSHISEYASGTDYIPETQLASVGEQGRELRVLNKGDGILSHNLTENLMKWGEYDPISYMNNNPFNIDTGGGSGDIYNLQFDKLVLPNVVDYNSFVRDVKSNAFSMAVQLQSKR